jgi:alkaline phosphatase D
LERQLTKQDTVWDLISSQFVVRDINFTLAETGGLGFPFEEMNQDAWDDYVANRNRVLQFILENSLKNSVILSGDFHIPYCHCQ